MTLNGNITRAAEKYIDLLAFVYEVTSSVLKVHIAPGVRITRRGLKPDTIYTILVQSYRKNSSHRVKGPSISGQIITGKGSYLHVLKVMHYL